MVEEYYYTVCSLTLHYHPRYLYPAMDKKRYHRNESVGRDQTIPVEQTTWGDWGMILLLFVAVGLVLYLAYKETRSSGALSWVEVMKTPAWLTLVGVVVVNIILALTLYPIWLIFWDYGPIFWAVNLGQ